MIAKPIKLSVKLPLAIGFLLLLSAAVTVGILLKLNAVIDTFSVDVAEAVQQERDVGKMNLAFRGQVQEWKDYLLRGSDPAKREKHWNAFVAREAEVEEHAKDLLARVTHPAAHDAIGNFGEAHRAMATKYRTGAEMFKAADFQAAAGDAAVTGIDRQATAFLAEASTQLAGNAAASRDSALAQTHQARLFSIIAQIAAVLLGIGAGVLISRSVIRQLGGEPADAVSAADAIAGGDLSRPIPVRSGDERSLMANLRQMQHGLALIVTQVRDSTGAVVAASEQIAVGNLDLSARTEEQASSLEETASAMEELTGTVQNNAGQAHQAAQLSRSARDAAVRGGDAVSQVVKTMQDITVSSQRIAEITSVIDGIAFQTNILALNAAVEAARAGEQGHGFAVVASEVRNLAQRCGAASKEISHLIQTSVEQVAAGNRVVDQAGETIQAVVESVNRVSGIIADISTAVSEQSSGIEQINSAISQMDDTTQQNAALVEEASAASQSLRDQAENLHQLVGRFKLEEGTKIHDAPKMATVATLPVRPVANRVRQQSLAYALKIQRIAR